MSFHAYDRCLDLLRSIAQILAEVQHCDRDLADQLRRAAQSCVLNVAEANHRSGKDRRYRFRIALASAAEVTACLDAAQVLGYVGREACAESLALADRVRAMTYKLAR